MLRLFLVALATLALSPRPAQANENDARYEQAGKLRPNQALWHDAIRRSTEPLTLTVSLALQRIYVYRGVELIGSAVVSTGRRGKATPPGAFQILQKARWHRSNLYSNAPMPFMQRLTWDGIALHAGHNPGYPASHGCIRLPPTFARTLFGMTTPGDAVTVIDYPDVAIEIDWTAVDLPDAVAPRLAYEGF